ncbi:MAG TPA: ATP synthase F0 subunit B [Candidatus Limnocylindrales bacterium]|nr:ATP synthase F0 subunit B [Candidatus Limnocylindrales bacterium]
MKKRITSAAIFAAAFFVYAVPYAHAAEESGADHGSWLLLTFFAINFVLFVGVLVYFAGPPIREFFADRAVTIRTALSRASSALAEAEDLANKAAARMAALSAELKKLADELEQETAFQVGKVADLAKSTAERIRRDTEMSSSALSEAAKRRVRAQLAESAATLASDLIGRDFQPADQGRLLDGFMDKLGSGDRQ